MLISNQAQFLVLFPDAKQQPSGWHRAACPVPSHGKGKGDEDPSFYFRFDGEWIALKCFGGCSPADIVAAKDIDSKQLFHNSILLRSDGYYPTEPVLVAEYVYVDQQGKELYVAGCFNKSGGGKTFKLGRTGGNGKVSYKGIGKTLRVLYHLDELAHEHGQAVAEGRQPEVLLAEGEKDCDLARTHFGVVATTNPQGCGYWQDSFADTLKGFKVYIAPDKDKGGLERINTVGYSLGDKAELYVLAVSDPYSDLGDWIEVGGLTREQYLAAKTTATRYQLPPELANRPEIVITGRPLLNQVKDTLAAIRTANNLPQLFVRSGKPVRITEDEEGRPIIGELQESPLRGFIERACQFVAMNKTTGEKEPKAPTDLVVRDILTYGDWPFPPLVGITEVPTIRPDGSVVTTPGYDPATRLYYKPQLGLVIPPIPASPTEGDVADARNLLFELFCDFPFTSDASMVNTLAALMTPVLRPLFHGSSPMAIFDKPQAGTGASLAAKVIAIITTGTITGITACPKDDEAWGKKLLSQLLAGRSVVVIDNIEGKLYAPTLAAVLTTDHWEDRMLGRNEMVRVPNRTAWIGTGNNIQLGGDLPRRCYWIRMDAQVPRPWLRDPKDFVHPDIEKWVLEERGAILAAILTLARSWVVSGSKPSHIILGGYESWVETIGGVLKNAGIGGFLANLNEMYEVADKDTPQTERFMGAWYEVLGDKPVTTASVKEALNKHGELKEALPDYLADYLTSDSFTRKLGNALAKIDGMHFSNGLCLKHAGGQHKVKDWKVYKGVEAKRGGLGGFGGSISPQCVEESEDDNDKNCIKAEGNKPLKPPKPPEPDTFTSETGSDVADPWTGMPEFPYGPCPACNGIDYWADFEGKCWVCSRCYPEPKESAAL